LFINQWWPVLDPDGTLTVHGKKQNFHVNQAVRLEPDL
jgi:hypothetical protein